MPDTDVLAGAQAALAAAEDAAAAARAARDREIRRAVRSGLSMYRVAQLLGISQTAVRKIVRGL